MRLQINERKTKYMIIGNNNSKRDLTQVTHISIDQYEFQRVFSFVYLGVQVNDKNDMNEEIERRIQNANKAYFGLLKHFKSVLLSRETQCNLYKTLYSYMVEKHEH